MPVRFPKMIDIGRHYPASRSGIHEELLAYLKRWCNIWSGRPTGKLSTKRNLCGDRWYEGAGKLRAKT